MVRPADGSEKLQDVVQLESLSWRKPGILEVVASRLSLPDSTGFYPEELDLPLDKLAEFIDSKLIGEKHGVQIESRGGHFKVSHIYRKFYAVSGEDDRVFGLRSGVERFPLRFAPFIDLIKDKYFGFENPTTREIEFPKTLPKDHLKQEPSKNPYGEPWTGHDWPELDSPPGHINNPFHGVQFFYAAYSEFSMEDAYSSRGSVDFGSVDRALGWAGWPPPVFPFTVGGAKGQKLEMGDGSKGKIKPQEKWIVVENTVRKQGEDFSETTVWRSRRDPGWPGPVYRRTWNG